MTDTARSLAAMLALLPDNSTAQISPQDLRDLAMSSVGDAGQSVAFIGMGASPLVTVPASPNTTSYGLPVPIPLNVPTAYSTAPDGWLDPTYTLDEDDPTNSWGTTWPLGTGLMLPHGFYNVLVGTFLSSPFVSMDGELCPLQCFLDQAEYDPDATFPTDRAQGFIYDGYYNGGSILSPGASVGADHTKIIYTQSTQTIVNDTGENKPFVVVAYTQGYLSTIALSALQLFIVKVG